MFTYAVDIENQIPRLRHDPELHSDHAMLVDVPGLTLHEGEPFSGRQV